MARLRNMTPPGGSGCRVVGEALRPDLRPLVGAVLRFTPAHSGHWQGRLIGRASVEVTTDASGRFAANLAPSSVVGRYEVVVGEARYAVDVPDQPTAAFWEIAQALG